MNKQRIAKMAARSKHVESSFRDSKNELAEFIKKNPAEYKELLKKLICQGLIKLMEAQVVVQVRKSDEPLVKEILQDSANLYKKIMKDNVKILQGQEPPCEVIIDSTVYLPEYNPTDGAKGGSCVGGVRLHARGGRIVCSNTLDERLGLCYQEAIPQIRKLLFPDYH